VEVVYLPVPRQGGGEEEKEGAGWRIHYEEFVTPVSGLLCLYQEKKQRKLNEALAGRLVGWFLYSVLCRD